VFIDILQGLGLDVDAIMKMSAQERVDSVREAATDGRLEASQVAMLQRMGILPD
jgi:hypothetical protein